jgi:hypothetical protein
VVGCIAVENSVPVVWFVADYIAVENSVVVVSVVDSVAVFISLCANPESCELLAFIKSNAVFV